MKKEKELEKEIKKLIGYFENMKNWAMKGRLPYQEGCVIDGHTILDMYSGVKRISELSIELGVIKTLKGGKA